ncbi:hypothetical protein C922_03408 [Plasmodium inui San Antonio 1]|uniref:Uncharacterized protein n=1 Tax=Plasmodium inui San Antonio 1 TaxID=1237626 RepID=W7A4J7_9APIC|nr:hypothetical protein C922_03408 [Plasmodium inui San Antonio 1]EUD66213.1 hypothetical protein C922_03408 [Plasmodium inui San Antonio 1]
MELLKVKRYAELIDEFARQGDELLQVENNTPPQKEGSNEKGKKKDVIEIIEYFSNMLVKYFYTDYQYDNISIVDSGFDSEQLWLFIECLIKEKKLESLLSFFEKYEKGLDSQIESERGTKAEDYSNEEEDDTIGERAQKRCAVNRVKMNTRGGPSSKRRKVSFSQGGTQVSNATAVSVDSGEAIKSGDAPGADEFFDEDEMHQFLDEEEKKMLRGESGDDSEGASGSDSGGNGYSDSGGNGNSDSGGEVDLNEFQCDYEEGRKLKYGDFYKGGEEEEEDDEDAEDEEEEDEDDYEDDDEEDEGEHLDPDDEGPRGRRGPDRRSRKERDEEIERELRRINEFDTQYQGERDEAGGEDAAREEEDDNPQMDTPQMDKDRMEKELIQKKHWSLTGEVSAHDRPKNSLLSLNVDIPKLNCGGNDAYVSKAVGEEEEEDDDQRSDENIEKGATFHGGAPGADGSKTKRRNLLNDEIEMVVKQRIQNMLFDDVERKRIEDLDLLLNESKERVPNHDEVNFDHLSFTQSKLSLADEYTKKYEEEIKASQSEKREINLQKLELMNLYKKIIHCCDSLCNDFYVPKPALLNPSNGSEQFASLHIEETVPIILSEKDRNAPEQLFQPGHIKQMEEMHQKEKKSMRKSNKVKRKKKLLHLFGQSGKGISELKKRNEYLSGKNRKVKGEKESAARYGVGSKDQLRGKGRNRYDFAGAISQAQARDASGVVGKR